MLIFYYAVSIVAVAVAQTEAVDSDVRLLELRGARFADLRAKAQQSPTGRVRVIVGFDAPDFAARREASVRSVAVAEVEQADAALTASIRAAGETVIARLMGTDFAKHRIYRSVPYAALSVSEAALAQLELMPDVITAVEDGISRPMLDNTVEIIGATQAWARGYDGTSWFVAVLDTGILGSHEMFDNATVIPHCFASGFDGDPDVGDCPNGEEEDANSNSAEPYPSCADGFDHGTHVAGIAAGNGPSLDGVARGSDIIAIKVFSHNPSNSDCGTVFPDCGCLLAFDSDIIAGLDWVFGHRQLGIAAVNMSLGSGLLDDEQECDDAIPAATDIIDLLRDVNIATVVASGNDSSCTGISWPACIGDAIAVGNVTDADVESPSSNYQADLLDLYAPGSSILSAVGPGNDDYGSKTGTSMAAPHVAGAWAIIRHAHPNTSVSFVKAALKLTGDVVDGRCINTPDQQRIRVERAVDALLSDTWVDLSLLPGFENGTILFPFNTLAEGLLDVPANGRLAFRASSTGVTVTITKAVTLKTYHGPTTIGSSP
jgi:subtilisin family serine protease